jgi:hypothetical protein
MGKAAALDLPDPLHTPDVGRPLTSTDDLLAQLAGEEIDRLLAEVDEQATAALPATPAVPTPIAPATAATPASAPPVAPEPADTQPLAEDMAAALAVAPNDAEVTAELDAFFRSAALTAPVSGLPAAPSARSLAAPSSAAAVPDDDIASAADLLGTSAAERAQLRSPAVERGYLAAAEVPAAAGEFEADEDALPAYLRPLEWINAPLEACSPGVRDFVGKAAIITLVNAAAVLLYVLLFRAR